MNYIIDIVYELIKDNPNYDIRKVSDSIIFIKYKHDIDGAIIALIHIYDNRIIIRSTEGSGLPIVMDEINLIDYSDETMASMIFNFADKLIMNNKHKYSIHYIPIFT